LELHTEYVLQFTLRNAEFVHLYGYGAEKLVTMNGHIWGNNLFTIHSDHSFPFEDMACIRGLHILKWKMKKTPDKTVYQYLDAFNTTTSTKHKISHDFGIPPNGLNTALFIKRFNLIQKALDQNAYFTPFLVSINSQWSLIYFGGAGNVKDGLCGDNMIHEISITTFDKSENNASLFKETLHRAFEESFTSVWCCETFPNCISDAGPNFVRAAAL
jgi:hypothetical protein